MNAEAKARCTAGGCALVADVRLHWRYSGEIDPMCVHHAGIALHMAGDATALMEETHAS
jgi:hypothetical protein